jgi:NTP pyrophosphatase (non-canonical NTP hydrolase)
MTEVKSDVPLYTFDLFQEHAMRTAKEIGDVEDILHATLGIGSEAGELQSSVKGWLAYGKDLDVKNIIEEMGDILWYIALMCKRLNIPMQHVAIENIAKLYARYPEKYTDEDAIARADKSE